MAYPTGVMKTKTKKAPVSKKPAAGRRPAAGVSQSREQLDPDLHAVLKHVNPQAAQAKDEQEAAEPIDEWVSVSCPFCGENIDLHVTSEEEGQTMTEDCEVCCRPVSMHITIEEGEVHVEAFRS